MEEWVVLCVRRFGEVVALVERKSCLVVVEVIIWSRIDFEKVREVGLALKGEHHGATKDLASSLVPRGVKGFAYGGAYLQTRAKVTVKHGNVRRTRKWNCGKVNIRLGGVFL